MREIFIRKQKIIPLFFTILLLIFTGCEGFNLSDINFGGDLRSQLQDDLNVNYTFYEYNDPESYHEDVGFMTGRTITEKDFPKYEHEETMITGWVYNQKGEEEEENLPPNFRKNKKGYIGSVKVGNVSESFYAVWRKKCTINFVPNWPGLSFKTQVLPEGDPIEAPIFENKQGNYRFWGWYTDEALTQYWNIENPVSGDMTLYGRWEEVRTIRYYKNDGSDQWTERDYPISSTGVIEGIMFGERNGYGFVGWSTNKNADVSGITDWTGDEFNVLEKIPNGTSLYAIWSNDVVTITYVDSSGAFANRTARYGRGAHVNIGYVLNDEQNWYSYLNDVWHTEGLYITGFSTSSTKPAHCEFDRGGHYDSDGDGSYERNYYVITGDLTLYTYWEGITFFVHFYYYDASGNQQSFANYEVQYNECATAPSTSPTVAGKIFEGWLRASWISTGESTGEWAISSSTYDFSMRLNNQTMNGLRDLYLFAKLNEAGHAETGIVTFAQLPDSDITVTDAHPTAYEFTFTAPAGMTSYEWYVDNALQTDKVSNEATFDCTNWTYGIHDLLLIVFDGTDYYSYHGKITKS